MRIVILLIYNLALITNKRIIDRLSLLLFN
jgi:hypothetical protein